ncbi:MAG: thioesterase [Microscillaceae bacterium]|nr:thioesterase [Microscillaceae bacterium]
MTNLKEILADYPAHFDVKVAWGEMDAALHVNNTVYLRYAESGRIDYFEKMGFRVNVTNTEPSVGPILAEIQCKYKAPVTFPDQLVVATRLQPGSLDVYSFWVEQLIVSQQLQRVVAEVKARLVAYDYQQKQKAPIPDELIAKLSQASG